MSLAQEIFQTGSRTLQYGSQENAPDLVLLELTPQLQQAIETQEPLCFKGDVEGDAYLCSRSKTLQVKNVDNSNTLLMISQVDEGENNDEIENQSSNSFNQATKYDALNMCSQQKRHLEVTEVAPNLEKLKQILIEKNLIRDQDVNMDQDDCCTFEYLLCNVEASEEELKTGLKQIGAVEINGRLGIMDTEFVAKITNDILKLIHFEGDLDNFLFDSQVIEFSLQDKGYSCEMLDHCLSGIGVKESGSMWKADLQLINRHYAREVLKNGSKPYHTFLNEFVQLIPKYTEDCVSQLAGYVLIDKDLPLHPTKWFSVQELPRSCSQRFQELFQCKQKWEKNEMLQYIADLQIPGKSVMELVMKYCRMQTLQDGTIIYWKR